MFDSVRWKHEEQPFRIMTSFSSLKIFVICYTNVPMAEGFSSGSSFLRKKIFATVLPVSGSEVVLDSHQRKVQKSQEESVQK